jgi:hypothetical protein
MKLPGWLRRVGVQRTFELEQDLLTNLPPQTSALGDTAYALAAAMLAGRPRFAGGRGGVDADQGIHRRAVARRHDSDPCVRGRN